MHDTVFVLMLTVWGVKYENSLFALTLPHAYYKYNFAIQYIGLGLLESHLISILGVVPMVGS